MLSSVFTLWFDNTSKEVMNERFALLSDQDKADVMTKMANEHGAINLSQGFPDYEIDPELIALVHESMRKGQNQYATMAGVASLRQILSEIVLQTYKHPVNWETDITITSGATEAIFAAITAFINPGDEVILFDPAYDSYDPAIRLSGGIPVQINLTFPGFHIDWDQVKRKISPRTRMSMAMATAPTMPR